MQFDHETIWSPQPTELGEAECALVAKSMIVARRALHGPLPSALIQDAALDILLHLFVARHAGTQLSIGDLLGSTTATPGTAQRWVAALVSEGLVDDTPALTPSGVETMMRTLRAVSRSQWDIH